MIPYGKQDITKEDIKSVVDILNSDFLTQGPAVPFFEKSLCDYTGAKYSIAVNSATSALHIACLSLGLQKGDVLWTSAISFAASANCAIYCGADVDFVDVDSDTGLMCINALRSKLLKAKAANTLPKIVIPVHLAGQPCNMKEIFELSKEFHFRIIEDAAHAIGAEYFNKKVGSCEFSDISVFSFHPVKIITTAEGGSALTNNKELADRMELLRSHGITREKKLMNLPDNEDWYYEQISLGFNYRMSDIHAALGISQIQRIESFINKRSKIAKWYDLQFENTPIKPLAQIEGRKSSHHLYIVRILEGEIERNNLYRMLKLNGINANLHYIPIYRHPFFNRKIRLFGTEEYYKSAITLPIYPKISNQSLSMIVDKVLENIAK